MDCVNYSHAAFCTFEDASFAERFICSAAESVEVDTLDLISFAVFETFSLGVWLKKGKSRAWTDICRRKMEKGQL